MTLASSNCFIYNFIAITNCLRHLGVIITTDVHVSEVLDQTHVPQYTYFLQCLILKYEKSDFLSNCNGYIAVTNNNDFPNDNDFSVWEKWSKLGS